MDRYYSKMFNYITKNNRKLSKTYIISDDVQKILITGFNNQKLCNSNKVSICAVLLTRDNKFIGCSRKNSFLYTEIVRSKNMFRKERLFLKYTKYLKKIERQLLSLELNLNIADSDEDHNNIIFPGGIPRSGEDPLECLSREIKEETNIDSKDILLDSRFFIHMFIEDLLTDRIYETILFFGKTNLTSEDVLNNFVSNKEIKSLVFLNKFDTGLSNDIIRFVLSISELKCFGNNGKIESLKNSSLGLCEIT
ncbi:MutT motif protein [Deerpox virus W-1170-84]|uniref:MutT motif protein n=1 Tax=Deerpox virus (strain W-1170-84) TaxID=305676 RepID=Q08F86_DPV84|nr:MutT motif protein [Deerpox virus W-1170-84]AYC44666.1 MutT motif protein [Moosepox virus GoldyGopher14]